MVLSGVLHLRTTRYFYYLHLLTIKVFSCSVIVNDWLRHNANFILKIIVIILSNNNIRILMCELYLIIN